MSKFAGLEMEVEKPFRMTIVHPVTRRPLRGPDGEAYIDIYSADSNIARRITRAAQRQRLNVRGRTKLTPEELEGEAVELLAALCAGWRLLNFQGEPIDTPFSTDNAREMLASPAMSWLREQVEDFAYDRSNFSTASSTNSSPSPSTNSPSSGS